MCRSCWKRWKNNGIVRKPLRFGLGYPLGKRVRPFRAAAFFQHRLSGAHELPQAGSLYPGGEVFAEPQRECADAARAHKRVDTYGFHPLVNHPFPLEGLAQIADM